MNIYQLTINSMCEKKDETGLLKLLRKDEQAEVEWRVGFALEELGDSANHVRESMADIDRLLGRIFRGRDVDFRT